VEIESLQASLKGITDIVEAKMSDLYSVALGHVEGLYRAMSTLLFHDIPREWEKDRQHIQERFREEIEFLDVDRRVTIEALRVQLAHDAAAQISALQRRLETALTKPMTSSTGQQTLSAIAAAEAVQTDSALIVPTRWLPCVMEPPLGQNAFFFAHLLKEEMFDSACMRLCAGRDRDAMRSELTRREEQWIDRLEAMVTRHETVVRYLLHELEHHLDETFTLRRCFSDLCAELFPSADDHSETALQRLAHVGDGAECTNCSTVLQQITEERRLFRCALLAVKID
jgi:hypothetical protein